VDTDIDFRAIPGDVTTTSACIVWEDTVGWKRTADCGNYYIYWTIDQWVDAIEVEGISSPGIEAVVINNVEGGSYFGMGAASNITPTKGGTNRLRFGLTCQYVHNVRIPIRSTGTPALRAIVGGKYECCPEPV